MRVHHYIGDGRFLVGVPARHLTADEVMRLPDRIRERLVKSGLYAEVSPLRSKKEAKPNV